MGLSAAMAGIGTGSNVLSGVLGFYGNMEAADTASSVANYNASIQKANADLTTRIQVRQSEINQSLLQTQINQTYALDDQAKETLSTARDNTRLVTEEAGRTVSSQRAGFAGNGVLVSGSALEVLADTEVQSNRMKTGIWKQADQQATALERQASISRIGLEAQMGVEKMMASAALASRKIAYKSAELTVAQGESQASAYKLAAYGSLLSGFTGAANSASGISGKLKPNS